MDWRGGSPRPSSPPPPLLLLFPFFSFSFSFFSYLPLSFFPFFFFLSLFANYLIKKLYLQIPKSLIPEFDKRILEKENCFPVHLDKEEAGGHYDIICKNNLWPIFHYIMTERATDGRKEKEAWEHYHSVNQKFADKVIEIYQPGDLSCSLSLSLFLSLLPSFFNRPPITCIPPFFLSLFLLFQFGFMTTTCFLFPI